MENSFFDTYFGGRKFFYILLVTLLAFILVLTEDIGAKEFLTFVGIVGAEYITGNVLTKFANRNNVK